MSTASRQHYDVIIAGARCAGAATALLLARQGARVLVLDKSRYGTDTLSTHALMRGAVLQLHRWGLLPAVAGAGTPPVRSTTFHLADTVTTIPVKPRHMSRRCTPRAGASWTRSWPTPRAAPARTSGSAPRSPACGGTGPGG
jgi:2-polyprenyl-6-methoxyphenol hydroxylase-like FAD-dependent oxidoreductase